MTSLIDNFGIKSLENKSLISCGEPLTSKLALEYSNKNPNNFLNLYGSTEVAPWILWLDVLDFINKNKILPTILPAGKKLPGVKLKFSDDNELLVNAECVFNGYLNNNNNETFIKLDNENFFRTGDQFSVIDDLYYCQGRLNNAIKIGGRFVNPIILESELKASFDFLNVLAIADQKNLILKVFLFTTEIQKDLFNNELIKTKIYENISGKINVKIKFIFEKPECLRSGKINRKYYENLY